MEQEIIAKIEIAFFIVIALSGIVILIFCLRRKDEKNFDWKSFERTVRMMHEQTDENLDMLSKMNKQKDKIEEKIKAKKKILGLKLVDWGIYYGRYEWKI